MNCFAPPAYYLPKMGRASRRDPDVLGEGFHVGLTPRRSPAVHHLDFFKGFPS